MHKVNIENLEIYSLAATRLLKDMQQENIDYAKNHIQMELPKLQADMEKIEKALDKKIAYNRALMEKVRKKAMIRNK